MFAEQHTYILLSQVECDSCKSSSSFYCAYTDKKTINTIKNIRSPQYLRNRARQHGWLYNTITNRILCKMCKLKDDEFRKTYKQSGCRPPACDILCECVGCETVQFYNLNSIFIKILVKVKSVSVYMFMNNIKFVSNDCIANKDCVKVQKIDWCHVCYAIKIVCALKIAGLPYDIVRLIMKDYLDIVYPIRK